MGNSVLKGISAALLVTIITLLAGMFWTAMGFGGLTMSTLVDIGLIASCITAGFWTGKESGQWILGGVASLGYVLLCVVLLALFLELSGWGVIQVLGEGGLIGILAGAFGVGGEGGRNRPAGSWRSSGRFSSWGDTYDRDPYARSAYREWDKNNESWEDWETPEIQATYDESELRRASEKKEFDRRESVKRRKSWEDESQAAMRNDEEDEWESWGHENKKASNTSNTTYRKAWWEEDVL